MTASDFHGKPVVAESVKHLDADVIVEVLSRHGVNVSEAAVELGVASADLRRLLWARPQLVDAAAEIEEQRLDLAERNIYQALKSSDGRERLAASMFVIRNSHRSRKRGWITSSTSAAELSASANADQPRTITFRWRGSDDELATTTFERDGQAFEVPKYGGGSEPIDGEVLKSPVLLSILSRLSRHRPNPLGPRPGRPCSLFGRDHIRPRRWWRTDTNLGLRRSQRLSSGESRRTIHSRSRGDGCLGADTADLAMIFASSSASEQSEHGPQQTNTAWRSGDEDTRTVMTSATPRQLSASGCALSARRRPRSDGARVTKPSNTRPAQSLRTRTEILAMGNYENSARSCCSPRCTIV